MEKQDVLVVGELNVDIILDKIHGFPEIGKEIVSENLNVTLGSSSAIFASNLSSLGTKVAFIGKVGSDSFSKLIIDSLKLKKVGTQHIISSDQYQTGLTMVMNYGTERANITYPGAMEHLSQEEVTDEMLCTAKHLHLSSIFLQTSILKDVVKLFSRAKSLGLTTSMDPQWDPSEKWNLDLEKLLPHIDIFMPNTAEFMLMTRCKDIASGLEKIKSYANTIVIKDGENGAHLWHANTLNTKPAFFNAEIIDCIGAGDSFDAGFINAFLSGKELEKCLEIGNVTGAINTTESGGTTAFTSKENIMAIAKEKFSYDLK